MSSEDELDSTNDERETTLQWSLDTIPTELFLHICSFLSAKFLINVLSKVCSQFKEIINEDLNWRVRTFQRWPKQYSVFPSSEEFDWQNACLAREVQEELWCNVEQMRRYVITGHHYSTIDAVLIIEDGNLCLSGGRDRSWKLWDLQHLKSLEPNPSVPSDNYLSCLKINHLDAHSGWLWAFAYDKFNQSFFSGGFDGVVKEWKMPQLPECASTYRLCSPVICLAMSENILFCGTHSSVVYCVDRRSGDRYNVAYRYEKKKPVLCMACDDRYVISGSEDKSIIVFDKVAGKVLNTFELENFPLCLSYDNDLLLAGDLKGHLHFISHKHGKFERLKSVHTGHGNKITALQHSLGSVITCSSDKTLRVMQPSLNLEPLTVLDYKSEVTGISTHNDTLVGVNSDGSILVWMPPEEE